MKILIKKLREILSEDKIRSERFETYVIKYTDFEEFKRKVLGLKNTKNVRLLFELHKPF
jgi:UDP-galactopyranose mutase